MAAVAAGDAVFRSIKANNSDHTNLSLLHFRAVNDEQLSILHFLYGKNFERAMQILDRGGVQLIVGEPSGRAVFQGVQVAGESKNSDQYICFPEHHCTCYSFFYETVNKGEQLCCKHQLAARVADAHKLYKEVKISDKDLALLLFKH
eukprot:Gb_39734 [translate_table: standard]